MQHSIDFAHPVRRSFAKAAVLVFLMTVTSPVLAMSQVEGRREPRTVFVETETLRRRRRAMDRYFGFSDLRFVYSL